MKKDLIVTLTTVLTSILLLFCSDKSKIANSAESYEEEILAYNDILNEIIDTSFYNQELAKRNKNIAIFFLFDTLSKFDNNANKHYPSDLKYFKASYEKRRILMEQINRNKKYKFIRATKYPKDTIIGETLHTLLQDSLTIGQDEWFTGKWLTLSRICFNSELTKGILFYRFWCGNLCSSGKSIEIEKTNEKWKVTKQYKSSVS